MDIGFIFSAVPTFLFSLFNPIVAIFLVSLATMWDRAKIFWAILIIATVSAISHSLVSDIIYSPEWALAFFQVILVLIIILPIWGLKFAIKPEALALALLAYVLFLGSNLFLSNVIGAVLYILVWLIFINGTYFTLKSWITTPPGK